MTRPLLVLSFLLTVPAFAYTSFTADARTGPAAFDQFDPVIASHGNGNLAAWTTRAPYPLGTSVWISTLDAAIATPLDPLNVSASGVSLSSGRDGWFAVWTSDKQLSAAAIDSFGRVERTTRVAIAGTPASIGKTMTAWNGAVHIAVCQCSTLSVTLFDDNADVIAGPTDIGDPQARIAVLADPSGFLVVSSHPTGDTDAIYGRRISTSGVAGDWFLIRSTASRINGLAATADGARDIIAWGDRFGVWSMAVGEASAQLTSVSATVSDVLVLNGRVWIAYSDNTPRVLTIGPDLTVTPAVVLPVGGLPRLAPNGSSVLAIGLGFTADADVFASSLTPTAAGPPFLISRSKTDQANGWLAGPLQVWDEQIGEQRQVFIGGFDRAGRQLSRDGDNTNPVAGFNGTSYLVVWLRSVRGSKTEVEVVARRVSATGEILDSDDIDIGAGVHLANTRVASDGVNWLVASIRDSANEGLCFQSGGLRVTLNRVTPDGVVLEGAGVVMPDPEVMSQSDVDVAWTGSRYLVAWLNRCALFHNPTFTSLRAAFVSSDLSDVDDFVVAPRISSAEYTTPRVAATSEQSLIAWSAGKSTQYRLVNGVSASRRHAFGAAAGAIDGTLLDVTHNPSGTFSLYTLADPTFATGIHGLFETVVFPGGTRTIPVFRFGYGQGEQLTGNVDDSLGYPRVIDSMFDTSFDPGAGARRLWWREVPGER